ncbi:hypothetical protein DF185_08005 [Marinifilum breve]|uniref:Uncharacterized protein n=1 Tax=Marinifilum breve TaxID=2184082 RepID=A0A2V3ZY80_9BACT|nr:hypothetical protein [Marinifilum breve]PXY01419.1 hypothetical protein DF185_08005 [Marinifilum breve]
MNKELKTVAELVVAKTKKYTERLEYIKNLTSNVSNDIKYSLDTLIENSKNTHNTISSNIFYAFNNYSSYSDLKEFINSDIIKRFEYVGISKETNIVRRTLEVVNEILLNNYEIIEDSCVNVDPKRIKEIAEKFTAQYNKTVQPNVNWSLNSSEFEKIFKTAVEYDSELKSKLRYLDRMDSMLLKELEYKLVKKCSYCEDQMIPVIKSFLEEYGNRIISLSNEYDFMYEKAESYKIIA